MELSINIFKGETFYIGTIIGLPEVVTQGKTIASTIKNLTDALHLYREDLADENKPMKEFS